LLVKRKVFGRIVHTPEVVKPVGYIWILCKNQIKNDEIVRYKAQLDFMMLQPIRTVLLRIIFI